MARGARLGRGKTPPPALAQNRIERLEAQVDASFIDHAAIPGHKRSAPESPRGENQAAMP